MRIQKQVIHNSKVNILWSPNAVVYLNIVPRSHATGAGLGHDHVPQKHRFRGGILSWLRYVHAKRLRLKFCPFDPIG